VEQHPDSPPQSRDAVGQAVVSSILGEDVKTAADKAAAEMAKIMEKTEGNQAGWS
jgi:hypothetical protein